MTWKTGRSRRYRSLKSKYITIIVESCCVQQGGSSEADDPESRARCFHVAWRSKLLH